ncbi:hypothetical protein LTR36_003387 [Oleoguttula mirabilis]|uniref:Uncharacterized protein n=1 Tax=Oleoguttula mirabilis TaxID=1507867 RepID=A0AAV9JJ74_9PEZI|nr:hypothetical protein LTR36_003387 [Oleoguttula mirabilis]
MVPRRPNDTAEHSPSITSDEASGTDVGDEQEPEQDFHTEESDISEAEDAPAGLEEEYHTEDSDDEDGDDGEPRQAAPYLPAHLLKPLPSLAHSAQQAVSIPWAQMTRPQKEAQRSRSRQAKRRVYDRLRQDTKGSGVLQAGRAAQVKRGVASGKDRVKSGRIGKQGAVPVSGRQQMLEHRKRAVEQGSRQQGRNAKKLKTKSK